MKRKEENEVLLNIRQAYNILHGLCYPLMKERRAYIENDKAKFSKLLKVDNDLQELRRSLNSIEREYMEIVLTKKEIETIKDQDIKRMWREIDFDTDGTPIGFRD